jgi:hypothetical protein
MNTPFEQWAKAEISRLRAEADTLQRALDKYSESQRAAPPHAAPPPPSGTNGHALRKGGRKKGSYGTKTAFVMGKVNSSGTVGISTEELFRHVTESNVGIKRSSLRSMLWHAKDAGDIEARNGRWYKKQEGPSA